MGGDGAGLTFQIKDDPFTPWHACAEPKDKSNPRLPLEPVHGWELTQEFRVSDVVHCAKECNSSLSEYGLLSNNCHDFVAEFIDTLKTKGFVQGDGTPESNKEVYM